MLYHKTAKTTTILIVKSQSIKMCFKMGFKTRQCGGVSQTYRGHLFQSLLCASAPIMGQPEATGQLS